jgi:hypothetical protein
MYVGPHDVVLGSWLLRSLTQFDASVYSVAPNVPAHLVASSKRIFSMQLLCSYVRRRPNTSLHYLVASTSTTILVQLRSTTSTLLNSVRQTKHLCSRLSAMLTNHAIVIEYSLKSVYLITVYIKQHSKVLCTNALCCQRSTHLFQASRNRE